MRELELISSNEWQDRYRIMEGYLFVVNKFRELETMGETYTIPKNYYKRIDPKIKGKLWILTRPVKRYGGYSYNNEGLLEPDDENGEFPIGTVFYNDKPVENVTDPKLYDCFVRASYDNLHNGLYRWGTIAKEIKKITEKYLENR